MRRSWLWSIAMASSLMVPSVEAAYAARSSAPHDARNTHNKVANDTMQPRSAVQLVQRRGGNVRRSVGGGGVRRSVGRSARRSVYRGRANIGRISRRGRRLGAGIITGSVTPRAGIRSRRGRIYRGGSRPRIYARRGVYRRSGQHYPRYRRRRAGYTYYYSGWWYLFPWWIATGPYYYYETPVYGDRCGYWHDRCVANWGYLNSNYYGCMRYYGCYPR